MDGISSSSHRSQAPRGRTIGSRLLHGSASILCLGRRRVAGIPSSLLCDGASILSLGCSRVGQLLRLDGGVRGRLLCGSRRLGALLLRKAKRLADV